MGAVGSRPAIALPRPKGVGALGLFFLRRANCRGERFRAARLRRGGSQAGMTGCTAMPATSNWRMRESECWKSRPAEQDSEGRRVLLSGSAFVSTSTRPRSASVLLFPSRPESYEGVGVPVRKCRRGNGEDRPAPGMREYWRGLTGKGQASGCYQKKNLEFDGASGRPDCGPSKTARLVLRKK